MTFLTIFLIFAPIELSKINIFQHRTSRISVRIVLLEQVLIVQEELEQAKLSDDNKACLRHIFFSIHKN